LATFCYAVGFVYGKSKLKGLTPLVAPTSQLIMASLVLLPISFFTEKPFEMPLPAWTSVGALFGLGIFGTGIAFIFYYKILETAGAMALSMVSYLLPLVGMALGVLFLNELFTWNAAFGGILILTAMMMVNGVFKKRARVSDPT
jgi:drug/metabolite transporter (DMT)-like permease